VNRIWLLLISALLAVLIALLGSYLVVISQNPKGQSSSPGAVYASATP
jgi:hypothetical protein